MKKNSDTPIQEDVVDGELAGEGLIEKDPIELTPRETLLEGLADARQEEIESEINEEDAPIIEDEDLSETDDVVIVEVKEDETGKEKKVTVKIDGEEEEVTPEEIREYQKNRSADLRMREASELKKANEEKEAELLKLQEDITANTSGVSDEKVKELASRLNQSVYDEDDAGTAEIVKEILSYNTAPSATPEVDDAAVERVLYRKEQKKAISRFETEHENLATDPDLRAAVNRQSILEKKKEPNASVWDIIDRSAVHVKKEMAQKLGLTEETEKDKGLTELEKRRLKKAESNDSVESTSSLKSSLETKKKKKLSAFNELKKSRGQRV